MKYIDSEKLIESIEEIKKAEYENCGGVNAKTGVLQEVQELIASLQQEQTQNADANNIEHASNLKHWLAFFGIPDENIENCITQIAQGYGAIRYLEGVQHGAEAVNELSQQEQPEVDLEEDANEAWNYIFTRGWDENTRMALKHDEFMEFARHFYELGLRAKKK